MQENLMDVINLSAAQEIRVQELGYIKQNDEISLAVN